PAPARLRSGPAAAGAAAPGPGAVAAEQARRSPQAARRRRRRLCRAVRRAARRHQAVAGRPHRCPRRLPAGPADARPGRGEPRRPAAQARRHRRRPGGEVLMAGAGGFRTGLRFALAVALAAAAMAGCSSKGKTREPAKLVSIAKEELRIDDVWSRHIGDGSDGYVSGFRVAVAEDAVFAASIDGKVYALNPKSGDLIWRAKTRARVISGPSVNGNQVLVGTLDGEVIALKRADGSELWRTRAPSEALAAPVGSGNTAVAKAVDGREYGLDAATGERRWAFDRNEPNLTLRGLSMPLIIGNRVYNGLDNGKLSVLNLLDGTQVWEQTISVPTGRSELDRVIDIDADMLPGNDGLFVVTYGGDLTLVDYNTGDSRWRRSVKSYAGMA